MKRKTRTTPKSRRPTDATMRNVTASVKRYAQVLRAVNILEKKVLELGDRLKALEEA